MSARYAEHAPPPELARYVACFWVFEGRDGAQDQRIVPDGRCELIFHYGAPYEERGADGALRPQPRALFAGQLTRPLHLRAGGDAGVVGVRFRTAAAAAYAQRPLAPFTDRRVPLGEIKPDAEATAARVATAWGEAGRLAAAASHVLREVNRGQGWVDPGVETAVAALRRSEGRVALDELTAETGRAARSLQRAFAANVGLSPRMLAGVIRFRRVFDVLQEASVDNWSSAAQAAGYFDHPQMARDFRRFVGCTASQFVRADGGLGASLVGLAAS